jgi:MFS family permease
VSRPTTAPSSNEPIPPAPLERSAQRQRLRSDLSACTGDGVTYSFMVGTGETYLAQFAVALGFSGVTSGLIAAAPPIAGGVAQLAAPYGSRLIGTPRRWVMVCAALQAMSLVLLMVGAVIGRMPAWTVFTCASLYWAGALAAASVWNTWVGEIFPARLRARYFSKRNRLCQFATLVGLIAGGSLIGAGDRYGHPLVGFAAAFGLAAASRFLSLLYLAAQGNPETPPHAHRHTSLTTILRARTEYGRIILAMILFQAAVQVGQPYFNPFMLKALDFSPTVYTVAIAAAFVSKSLALPLAGRLADRHGAKRVLIGAAIGISMLALVWMVSASPYWIIPTQFAAGAIWGAYELALFLLLLETIPTVERTSVMTWYYLLNSLSMLSGSLVGAAILHGEETWMGYATVFAASTLLRFVAVTRFVSLHADVHEHTPLTIGTLAVRASAGSIDTPQGGEGSRLGEVFHSHHERDLP